jgi:hypothetical protein
MRLILAIFASVVWLAGAQARELTAPEKGVIGSALARDFRDPPSAEFRWTPWQEVGSGDTTVMYCGEVNAKGASGKYEGYVPYLAAVLVRSGKIADAILIATHFPSPARAGSPMRQCIGKVGGS